MKVNSRDLKTIVHRTLEHYDQRAEAFWAGTRDHDVSQNIAAMLQYNQRPYLDVRKKVAAQNVCSGSFALNKDHEDHAHRQCLGPGVDRYHGVRGAIGPSDSRILPHLIGRGE